MTSSQLHTYSAEKAPKGMLRHVLPLLGYPGVILGNRGLVWNFFRRELLGRFRGSFLGIFWVLVQPMFLFAIYYFVFGFLFAHPRTDLEDPSFSFALYLFAGILAFTTFSEATTRCCGVILENGNLVKKVAFPGELLPVHHILVSLIVYTVGVIVVFAVGLSSGELTLSWNLLGLPLIMLVGALFTLGAALFLACLQVFMRDTSHLYMIFAQAWFFLSPVFWYPSMMTDKLGGPDGLYRLFTFNPLYPIVMGHRQAIGIHFGMEGIPGFWVHLGQASIWALIALVVGYSFFLSRKHKFADLV